MKSPVYKFLQLIIIVLFLAAAGCTCKERVYENMYKGLQMREQIVNPTDNPVPPPSPNYSDYKRDREKILKEDKEEQK